jgi:hypothetical protein
MGKFNRFKENLFGIVLGTNIAVLFFNVRLESAIFSLLTFTALAYIIKPEES